MTACPRCGCVPPLTNSHVCPVVIIQPPVVIHFPIYGNSPPLGTSGIKW